MAERNTGIDGSQIRNLSVATEDLKAEAITEPKLDILNAPVDNYVLAYDSATGRFEWVSATAGGGDFSNGGEAGGADRSLGNTDAYALSLLTNNLDFIKGHSNGIVDLSRQSACYVYRSATQSINSGGEVKVQFNVEDYDVQSEFDSTTNYRFTANKAGKYLISFYLRLDAMTDQAILSLKIKKNGVDSNLLFTQVSGTSSAAQSMTVVLNLAVNDYIEFYVYHNSGTAKNIGTGKYNGVFIHKLS